MKLGIALLVLLAAALSAAEDEAPWFNHKRHADLKLECGYCHAGTATAARAGMPAAERCLECHKAMPASTPVLQKLVKLAPDAKPFHAEYDTLPDYVIFSHARHTRGRIGCPECHGNVYQQDQAEPARAMNMKACIDCHKQHRAKVICVRCHELGQ